ncbi:Transposase [Borrelia duttonii CR2A]|uniref:Transposase n=1 Tax=Borrelia duttonii CR2A TaxID=1432657 RepID=W6TF21_9SPIR|nr:Transposase [Borrelia duttonii CR2A]
MYTLHDRDINAALNLKAYYYKEIKTKAGTA